MKSYNQVIFKGTLGRDAKITNVNGKRVANFSVATEYRAKKPDGTFITETTWLQIAAWEGFGICSLDELTKGKKVSGTGRLRLRKYPDINGNDREIMEVIVDGLDLVDETWQETAQKSPETKGSRYDKGNYQSQDEDIF